VSEREREKKYMEIKMHRAGGVDKKNEGEWAESESRSAGATTAEKQPSLFYTNELAAAAAAAASAAITFFFLKMYSP
jgi:hypothetical protein